MRKTTDGGRHWSPIAAPPAPWPAAGTLTHANSVDEIYFADARDGWAFGPGLWATHDGGATWRRVDTRGLSVFSLAATDGHVIAVFQHCVQECSSGAASTFTVETSPSGADAWRPVPGGGGIGLPVVTAAGGTAYALGADGTPPKGAGPDDYRTPTLLLSGPADGTAPWRRQVTPCVTAAAATITAVTANSLLMACGLLGAHPTTNHLYRSQDSGAHWRQFANVGLYDGADTVAATPDGKLFVDGIVAGLELSRDGGRSWLRPATLDGPASQVENGGLIEFGMTTNNDGFLVARYGPFWITSDGGLTWMPVTVR
jgi:photosystem II stability/assembly factor-like uncharacterized protein